VYVCVYLYLCNLNVYRYTHILEYILSLLLCVRALVCVFLSALSLAPPFA
jgi:hypothetical protein